MIDQDLLCPNIPTTKKRLYPIVNYIKWRVMLTSYTLRDPWDIDGAREMVENINSHYIKYGRAWW